MEIYVFFFFVVILGLFPNPSKYSQGYLFLISLILFVIIGFRDVSVGVDTLSYVEDYKYYCRLSWNNLVQDAMTTKKEPVNWSPLGINKYIETF